MSKLLHAVLALAKSLIVSKSQLCYFVIFCCALAAPLTTQAEEINFDRDIKPIFDERCAHCHGEDEQESGLRLDLRANLLEGGDSGLAAIVPGEASKSYLMDVIKHFDDAVAMPPDEDKLSDQKINLIERWIKEGAQWPGQMETVEKEKSDLWSFQPVKRADIPTVANEKQKENPIDAFLLEKLAVKGLAFSTPTDPHSLSRRVSIILTGLPPTPLELERFLVEYQQNPTKAYSSLVDRLLASKHFGERWAQHWLDSIRWSETNGSESNMYRKNAWKYRDYVISAFNEDKPYNEFLFEQFAGDSVGRGVATGYLVAGPHVPVATVGQEASARRQARADRLDEILKTVGASAMGMTIGCARCHNHKFDPISIKEYYSMAAVFQDIEYGSRVPEVASDDPGFLRSQEIEQQLRSIRAELEKMGPWEEHWQGYREVRFEPLTTKSVRITFPVKKISLDELEIYSTSTPQTNLALASLGTKVLQNEDLQAIRTSVANVNDGLFGTERWGARSNSPKEEPVWLQFDFLEPKKINRIVFSQNRQDFFETDYLSSNHASGKHSFLVEVAQQDGSWKPVASSDQFDELNKRHQDRASLILNLQHSIKLELNEGMTPSFVGRFVEPATTYVFARGSPESPRDEVHPAGLNELDGQLSIAPNARGLERRKAFVNWLTNSKHPLTARVFANRLWHHVFGRGIVTTTSDFGFAGAVPTHPELLDWLAAELVQPTVSFGDQAAEPWSMKHLIRMMVLSEAFQQSSTPNDLAAKVDSGARLLWRFPPRRVEAEVVRDAVLQASGKLDRTLGGPGYRIHNIKKRYAQWKVVDNHGQQTWRRMIYQERMRRVDDQMFSAFDFPDCGQVLDKRPISTTPLQALNLLNGKFVMEQSERISQRAMEENEESEGTEENLGNSVDSCIELLLSRRPDKTERDELVELAEKAGLAMVCRVLINSNEFLFLP